ncbi:MarR family winged helix-turn-helix transcriptional regulator [Paenibacillus dauci]|uniref:MarR family winged helix-turn-helix transcriptional regulator n=1 Tax=Paenibacillus dauci TaxID=1567106 RepID=UPI00061924D0|nr:MarR family transcriptional regulator [Paenibacillus dauci]
MDSQSVPSSETMDSPAHIVKVLYIMIRREIEAVLRPLGLTPQQGQALHALSQSPGLTNTELEHQLMIEKSSVTSLMNGMEKKGWITRRSHPEDARMRQNELTEAGQQMNQSAHAAVEEVKLRSRNALTDEELRQLTGLLSKLHQVYRQS